MMNKLDLFNIKLEYFSRILRKKNKAKDNKGKYSLNSSDAQEHNVNELSHFSLFGSKRWIVSFYVVGLGFGLLVSLSNHVQDLNV